MSSLPNEEGMAEVIRELEILDKLYEEEARLHPEINRLRLMEKRLSEVQAKIHSIMHNLPDLLAKMDVHSPGNYGWERRCGWFLRELRRQILAKVPKGCVACGGTGEVGHGSNARPCPRGCP